MIKVSCESCGKQHKVNPTAIKSKDIKASCKGCGQVMHLGHLSVDNEAASSTATQPSQSYAETEKVPFNKRLQVKVNAVLISLIVVIMGLFTVYSYVTIMKKMERDLNQTSKVVANRLSNYLIEPFWSLDDEILSGSLKAELLDERVYAINVLDRDKSVYMGFKRDENWELIQNQTAVNNEAVKASQTIVKEKEEIGAVEVYLTAKFIKQEVNKSMINIGVTAFALILAVSLSVFLVINNLIVAPIKLITKFANEISYGNLEIASDIPVKSQDEIGVLAEAFGRMRTSITLAIDRLQKRKS